MVTRANKETGEIEGEQFPDPTEDNPGGMRPATPSGYTHDTSDYDDLLNQVAREVAGWRPEPGDQLYGVVVDISEGSSEYGDYPLLTVDSPQYEQLVGVHCFHTTLRNEVQKKIDRQLLVIGAQVAVRYIGLGESTGKGNAPELYRIAVRSPQGNAD